MSKEFYNAIRHLFGGSLTATQVEGLEDVLYVSRGSSRQSRAYILATAFHETGRAMAPNVENLNYTSATRLKAVWPKRFPSTESTKGFIRNPKALANLVYNGRMGNRPNSDDGWAFRGRGQVHLTGRDNYARAGAELGLALVDNPDLALDRMTSARILVRGMVGGWFTGKRLADFGSTDYVKMRAIVNGSDEAQKIASYAKAFEQALLKGGDYVPVREEPVAKTSLIDKLVAIVKGMFHG